MSTVALSKISKFVMGQAPPSSACNMEGIGTPFVKAGEFGTERPIIREWTTNPLKLAKRGDVLICVVGATAGKLNLGEDCAIGRSVAAIRPDEKKIDQTYLYNYLQTWVDRLRSASQGCAQRVITKEMLGVLQIPLPPLAEQKRIAAILDKADAIRRKRQAAIKLANDFLRATFLDMFGDPVTNPKGWDKASLGMLIKLKSGAFLPAKKMSDGSCPVYGGNGINGFHDEYMFEKPMLVIGRVGAYCGVIHKTGPKSWITDNALYVSEKSDKLTELYLEWALRMAGLNQYANQAGQPLISGGRIYPVEINVPPIETQLLFEKIQFHSDKMKKQLTTTSENSTILFNSLTQRAFRGEL